jgi:hypothetical protein
MTRRPDTPNTGKPETSRLFGIRIKTDPTMEPDAVRLERDDLHDVDERHVCVDGQVRPGHRDFCHACYQHAYRGTVAGQMDALRSAVIELGRVMAEAIIPRRWRA